MMEKNCRCEEFRGPAGGFARGVYLLESVQRGKVISPRVRIVVPLSRYTLLCLTCNFLSHDPTHMRSLLTIPNFLSHDPTHMRRLITSAKRVLEFLIHTKDLGIVWSISEQDKESGFVNVLFGTIDTSFVMCTLTYRSHSDYTTFLYHGLESWKSKL